MNDLVSRELVIKAIKAVMLSLQNDKDYDIYEQAGAYNALGDLVKIISAMPTSSGWISTKDRLPEELEDVLVCYIERDGKYKVETSYRYDYSAWSLLGRANVEYWQPLPEPPEKENNDE